MWNVLLSKESFPPRSQYKECATVVEKEVVWYAEFLAHE